MKKRMVLVGWVVLAGCTDAPTEVLEKVATEVVRVVDGTPLAVIDRPAWLASIPQSTNNDCHAGDGLDGPCLGLPGFKAKWDDGVVVLTWDKEPTINASGDKYVLQGFTADTSSSGYTRVLDTNSIPHTATSYVWTGFERGKTYWFRSTGLEQYTGTFTEAGYMVAAAVPGRGRNEATLTVTGDSVSLEAPTAARGEVVQAGYSWDNGEPYYVSDPVLGEWVGDIRSAIMKCGTGAWVTGWGGGDDDTTVTTTWEAVTYHALTVTDTLNPPDPPSTAAFSGPAWDGRVHVNLCEAGSELLGRVNTTHAYCNDPIVSHATESFGQITRYSAPRRHSGTVRWFWRVPHTYTRADDSNSCHMVPEDDVAAAKAAGYRPVGWTYDEVYCDPKAPREHRLACPRTNERRNPALKAGGDVGGMGADSLGRTVFTAATDSTAAIATAWFACTAGYTGTVRLKGYITLRNGFRRTEYGGWTTFIC